MLYTLMPLPYATIFRHELLTPLLRHCHDGYAANIV